MGNDPLKTTSTVITSKFVATGVTSVNTATINAPIGGMGQFKGLTQGTQQDKYVKVICKGVQPLYYTNYPKSLDSGAQNGWILSCYTGIAQCATSVATTTLTILDNVTATESSDCMSDPRYLTWRVMTMKLLIDGSQMWYRVDSYWNSANTALSSTWGTGVIMSTNHILSTNDNSGTTNLGKTFVFAYGDGSGIQLNHLTFNSGPVAVSNT